MIGKFASDNLIIIGPINSLIETIIIAIVIWLTMIYCNKKWDDFSIKNCILIKVLIKTRIYRSVITFYMILQTRFFPVKLTNHVFQCWKMWTKLSTCWHFEVSLAYVAFASIKMYKFYLPNIQTNCSKDLQQPERIASYNMSRRYKLPSVGFCFLL